MPYAFLAAVYLFAFCLGAHEWDATFFACEGSRAHFTLKIVDETKDVELLNLIAHDTVWLAASVKRMGSMYKIYMFRPTSAGSGKSTEANEIRRIGFVLPKAKVREVQTGGYYAPVLTRYPPKFTMRIQAKLADKSERIFEVDCIGR